MKLILYDVDFNNETDWADGEVIGVVCKSRAYFASLVAQCNGYADGHIAVLFGDRSLNWTKEAVVILDYYSLATIGKTVFAKYCKLLDSSCRGDEYTSLLDEVEQAVCRLLRQIEDTDLQWDYDVPRTISSYLKLCNAHIANTSGTIVEDLQNLITIVALTKAYEICVLINAKSFFSVEELNEIIKCTIYSGLKLLLVDNVDANNLLQNEKKIVVDEDFYDIMITV